MTSSRSYLRRSVLIASIVLFVSIASLILCAFLVGCRYETHKFKAFLTTVTLVIIYQLFFADVILMFLKATIYATFRIIPGSGEANPPFVGGLNKVEYLKRKINALKCQVKLGPTFYKRNEDRTLKYKDILGDLILYGSYLVILLFLINGTRDPLAYYNTRTIKDVLRNPKFSEYAIKNIITIKDVYNFINGTIIGGFNDGTSYNGERFEDSGWMDLQIAKVLGVVRLRQIRHKKLQVSSKQEKSLFDPGWQEKDSSILYKDKFWRIFQPWEYQSDVQTGSFDRKGKLYHQPGGGYVALLGRNLVNSHRVLNFLYEKNWIDRQTAALIIEFTLYNVDADLFTLVIISAEQTAFNSFVVTDKIQTVKLLFNIDNLPWYVLLTLLLYFIVMMRVVADMVLKMWYSPSVQEYLSMSWNYVDMAIVGLNVSIAIGVWIREVYVKNLLQQLETSRKNQFVPFYRAAYIDELCTILVAFLVSLATLRLWKILQFARVFRVLTSTLHAAKGPLASTSLFIAIFIIGMGLAVHIVNGSNSPSFSEFLKSITTLMTLSFGFAGNASPKDMNYGGSALGFFLYMLLVVSVTIFLLNMFITVVCLHYSKQKAEDIERSRNADHYTFWRFFREEISEKWPRKGRKNIRLTSATDDEVKESNGVSSEFKTSRNEYGDDQIHRIRLVSDILDCQMELLDELRGIKQGKGHDTYKNAEEEGPEVSGISRNNI